MRLNNNSSFSVPGSDGKPIECSLEYRKRKTLGITVTKDGYVKVAAPVWMSKRQVLDAVAGKLSWIIRKLEFFENVPAPVQRTFEPGEIFLFKGITYSLDITGENTGRNSSVRIDGKRLLVAVPQNLHTAAGQKACVRELLRTWYIGHASELINASVKKYAAILSVRPERITLRQQKSRWGSCSAKGSINFNWKIIMAPPDILDFIVVHELAHLVHMDHSPKFWALVGSILPEYRKSRLWLRTHGKDLIF